MKITEIRSKDGLLVFKRWRLFESKYFNIYIHKIFQSDIDHPHNHPWNFLSIVLWGAFYERFYRDMFFSEEQRVLHHPFSAYFRTRTNFHKNRIIKPVTTLVFTFGEKTSWGYFWTKDKSVHYRRHDAYRDLKNKGELND